MRLAVEDAELNRLGVDASAAYQRKLAAWQEWTDAKRRLEDLRYSRDPRITQLAELQQQAHADYVAAADKRQIAYIARDYDSTAYYKQQANDYRAQRDAYVVQIRTLIAAKRAELERLRQDKEAKRDNFRLARNAYVTALAIQAGIPEQYLDNVQLVERHNGTLHFYFGGEDRPDGEGHGHYVMMSSGRVTYKRNPGEPHNNRNSRRLPPPNPTAAT